MKQNKVYLIKNPTRITKEQYELCFGQLSKERMKTVDGYRFYKDRVLSVLAAALLAYALKKSFGISPLPAVTEGIFGKPAFRDYPEICFNLSHCEAAVACVISTGEVGVDVQESRDSLEKVAKRCFSEKEKRMIAEADDYGKRQILYRRVWSLKEAYGKYTGKGILYDLPGKDFSNFLSIAEACRPYKSLFDGKWILLLDDPFFSMAAYTDEPIMVESCSIDDLCREIKSEK